MNPITSKGNFIERYRNGEFGNAAPTWPSIKEFLDYFALEFPPDDQLFHLRSHIPGGRTYYNRSYLDIAHSTIIGNYYVSAMAPTGKTTLQGEVRRAPGGLELRYTRVRKPMREALAEEQETTVGLKAKVLLTTYMNQLSYYWLEDLLDAYPEHIVEFSTYSVDWGTMPGFNTVFWEVRPDRNFGSDQSIHTEIY